MAVSKRNPLPLVFKTRKYFTRTSHESVRGRNFQVFKRRHARARVTRKRHTHWKYLIKPWLLWRLYPRMVIYISINMPPPRPETLLSCILSYFKIEFALTKMDNHTTTVVSKGCETFFFWISDTNDPGSVSTSIYITVYFRLRRELIPTCKIMTDINVILEGLTIHTLIFAELYIKTETH